MSKQTAVEWLFDQLPDELRLTKSGFDMLQQAKAIEREQIEEAYYDGTDLNSWFTTSSEYYKQKYGKEASHEG